ncbi:Uncharacterized protein FWK35_00018161 [Aphis craccivora]|uniref:Uncharacterized protein n=1 Tax=Aphis craccivora TaxID=307492 RepID=A0A6G0W4A3_APHCR|nr:Uncharacterized protein FWK35_00018161 [Aphis craccivora]
MHFYCTKSPSRVTRSLRLLGQLKTKISLVLSCNATPSRLQR